MFIFGWGTRQRVINTGRFQCPVCKSETAYSQIGQRRWFTLFFVPIVPLSDSKETVRCERCQTSIPMEMFTGVPTGGSRVSTYATFGMLLGVFSFMTFCVVLLSIPMSIAAVILGHLGLKEVRKNQPQMEGHWQAVVALVSGYAALLLALLLSSAVVLAPWWAPRDNGQIANLDEPAETDIEDGPVSGSKSAIDAFQAAEYEIAAKRDKPAGRGNNQQAIKLATLFADKMKDVSEVSLTYKGGRPILQLSDGEYLTYCQLNEDSCLFLVHVPSYRNFKGGAKESLAKAAWLLAQFAVDEKLPAGTKLGVGLRGVLFYGDIMIGKSTGSTEENIQPYRAGKKADLITFFEPSAPKADSAKSLADAERVPTLDALAESKTSREPETGKAIEPPAPAITTPSVSHEAPAAQPGLATNNAQPAVTPAETSPLMIEPTPPKPNIDSSIASTNTPRSKPRKPPAKVEFKNQIPVTLVRSIENELWGFTSLAISPDGQWLAAAKMDEVIHVFDLSTGKLVAKKEDREKFGHAKAIAFSNGSDVVIAGDHKGQLMSYQVGSKGTLSPPTPLHRFESEVQLLVTSPKHPFLMSASRKGGLIWQAFGASPSQPRSLTSFTKPVRAVWLPTSGAHALATDGEKLLKFALKDGAIAESKDLGIKFLEAAAFSSSGKRLAAVTYDTWHMLDLESDQPARVVQSPNNENAKSLLFHPNERWFLVGVRGKVGIVDFEQGELIAYADVGTIFHQTNIALSADGKLLATCSDTARDPIKIFQLGE